MPDYIPISLIVFLQQVNTTKNISKVDEYKEMHEKKHEDPKQGRNYLGRKIISQWHADLVCKTIIDLSNSLLLLCQKITDGPPLSQTSIPYFSRLIFEREPIIGFVPINSR